MEEKIIMIETGLIKLENGQSAIINCCDLSESFIIICPEFRNEFVGSICSAKNSKKSFTILSTNSKDDRLIKWEIWKILK